MERRYSYTDTQTDIIEKLLRKLLEKIFKLKSADSINADILNISNTNLTENEYGLTIETLKDIDDKELVLLLTEKYNYSNKNLETLANIVYQLYKLTSNQSLGKKALLLYNQSLTETNRTLDLFTLLRKSELEKLKLNESP